MPNVEIFPHIPNHHFTLRNATKWRENKRERNQKEKLIIVTVKHSLLSQNE